MNGGWQSGVLCAAVVLMPYIGMIKKLELLAQQIKFKALSCRLHLLFTFGFYHIHDKKLRKK